MYVCVGPEVAGSDQNIEGRGKGRSVDNAEPRLKKTANTLYRLSNLEEKFLKNTSMKKHKWLSIYQICFREMHYEH